MDLSTIMKLKRQPGANTFSARVYANDNLIVHAILSKEDQMRKRIEKEELIFDILELEKYFQD